MKKCFLSLLMVCAFSVPAFGQIKIEGEKEATVGYMLKLKLSKLEVDDPQIKCFPDNPDWIATKDFAGQAWIIYVPGKKAIPKGQKSSLFTFVVAGNKGGKTFLETWEVKVKPDEEIPEPTPPDPTPDPVVSSKLYKDLFATYKVSPDATSKSKLIDLVYSVVLEDIKNDKFSSNKEVHDSLKAVTPKVVQSNLQGVRDVVADYLVAKAGASGLAYDKSKLIAAFEDVIKALKKVPE